MSQQQNMDEEFPTSPSKRRRTMSPDETTQTEPEKAVAAPETAYQPPQPDPAVREEIERKVAAENNFLDVLMQQVEAQSTAAQTTKKEAEAEATAPDEDAARVIAEEPQLEQTDTKPEQDPSGPIAEPQEAPISVPESEAAPDTSMVEGSSVPSQPPAEREWETDSSPYESDTSSDDSSSSDDDSDDDADGDYAMLDPEEAARILMQDDGGSDDEGKAKDPSASLRTAHEQPEEIIPKPDITVTESTPIVELGNVEFIVENTVLVKAKTSGEYQVLESGSALCLKDRTVIGAVSETIGRVEEPMYTVRFTNSDAIKEAGVAEKGTTVYYVVPHSTFVFTQPLKAFKGSDASNIHDEEVGAEEMEFSDDEKEAEHKRQLKLKRQGRTDDGRGRGGGRGRGRGGQHLGGRMPTVPESNGGVTTLDYDDTGEDYTPLARPSNLHEMMGGAEPGEVSEPRLAYSQNRAGDFQNNRGGRGGRGRGHPRGRGRGGGRGGGGGFDNRGGRGGFTQQQHQNNTHHQHHPYSAPQQPQIPRYPFSPQLSQYPPYQPPPPLPPSAPQIAPQHSSSSSSTYPSYTTTPFSPSPISPLPPNGGGTFNFPGHPQQQPQFPPPPNITTSLPPPPPPPQSFGFGQSVGQQQGSQPPSFDPATFARVQQQMAAMLERSNNKQ